MLIGRFVDLQALPLRIVIDEGYGIESEFRRADEGRIDASSQRSGPQDDRSSCPIAFPAQDAHAAVRFPFLQSDEDRDRDRGKGYD